MDTKKILFTALSAEELSEIMETSVRNVIGHNEIRQSYTDQLLNAREASKLVNYRRSTIYGFVRNNKIPFSKTAGKLLFSRTELLEWARQYKKKPTDET
ncbi:DNA binding domain, excisionase family [Sphingobacterium spiritivorum ATCC 33300]|uniref:DNA binding domain, excisionase family n=1 Tax=Sphingobacterium spiritivorum ATCC 33300 TaxID=525372 RepID=C2G4V6_SPHSI|nr:helix-turn-helix domain-containing protein [Sphingobacterium spiritivorum]EEI89707.1 DNA binding domain, excisionase family [Sphingobacterium spiritivorum ATCC 33300]QQS94761.1 helix-turn-helix domain-containing protein [Sphingobacterium spiritivorum]